MIEPSKRLAACIALGSIAGVFELLKSWPVEELQALIDDAEVFYDAGSKAIDQAWTELAFKPDNFLRKDASKGLDDARRTSEVDLLALCSEITSVAMFYLRESEPAKL